MSETQHTPTPWNRGGRYGLHFSEILSSDNSQGIGHLRTHRDKPGVKHPYREDTEPDPVGQANFDFALRACNTHGALLAAVPDPDKLDWLASWIDSHYPLDKKPKVQDDLRKWAVAARVARVALAKASAQGARR